MWHEVQQAAKKDKKKWLEDRCREMQIASDEKKSRKYLYLSFQIRQTRNSKCYTHIVGVQLLNGVVINTVGSNRKSESKYGGRNIYISDFRFDPTSSFWTLSPPLALDVLTTVYSRN